MLIKKLPENIVHQSKDLYLCEVLGSKILLRAKEHTFFSEKIIKHENSNYWSLFKGNSLNYPEKTNLECDSIFPYPRKFIIELLAITPNIFIESSYLEFRLSGVQRAYVENKNWIEVNNILIESQKDFVFEWKFDNPKGLKLANPLTIRAEMKGILFYAADTGFS